MALSNHIGIREQLTRSFPFFSLISISLASGWQILTFQPWPYDTVSTRDIKENAPHLLNPPLNINLFNGQWFPDVVQNRWQRSSCTTSAFSFTTKLVIYMTVAKKERRKRKYFYVCNRCSPRHCFRPILVHYLGLYFKLWKPGQSSTYCIICIVTG